MFIIHRNSDQLTKELLARITKSKRIFMVPAMVNGKYTIRYCVMYEHTEERHVEDCWKTIQYHADQMV